MHLLPNERIEKSLPNTSQEKKIQSRLSNDSLALQWNSGVSKLWPVDQIHPTDVFVNTVLLKHSMSVSEYIVYSCFLFATTARDYMNKCNRDCMAWKTWNIYYLPLDRKCLLTSCYIKNYFKYSSLVTTWMVKKSFKHKRIWVNVKENKMFSNTQLRQHS